MRERKGCLCSIDAHLPFERHWSSPDCEMHLGISLCQICALCCLTIQTGRGEEHVCALHSIPPCKSAKWTNIHIFLTNSSLFEMVAILSIGIPCHIQKKTFSSVQLQFDILVKVIADHSNVKLMLFVLFSCFFIINVSTTRSISGNCLLSFRVFS